MKYGFANRRYASLEELARHAEEVANHITPIPEKRRTKPIVVIGVFGKLVVKLAPKLRTDAGLYNTLGIVRETFRREGVENPTQEQLRKRRERVANQLIKLKKLGMIERAQRIQRPPNRIATEADMRAHIHLVERNLRYSGRTWLGLLDEDEARQISRLALMEAIQSARKKTRVQIANLSVLVTRRRLIDAIRAKHGRGKRRQVVEFVEESNRGKNHAELMDVAKQQGLDELAHLHALHLQGIVDARKLMAWTLHRVHGYYQREVGQAYGVTESRVCQIVKELDKLVERPNP